MSPREIQTVESREDVKRRFRQIDRSFETISNEIAAVGMAHEQAGSHKLPMLIALMEMTENVRQLYRDILTEL